jgi:hypothetical protein
MRMLARVVVAAAVVFGGATGCITHLPPRTTTHLRIHWQPSFDAARDEAMRAHKPLLVLLIAGEIAGPC